MRLKNKVALITGAARGIGRACAEVFAKEGATVLVTDIDEAQGKVLVQQLADPAIFHYLDVKNEADWVAISEFIKGKFKHLDILVNNAGITGFVPNMGLQDPEHASLET